MFASSSGRKRVLGPQLFTGVAHICQYEHVMAEVHDAKIYVKWWNYPPEASYDKVWVWERTLHVPYFEVGPWDKKSHDPSGMTQLVLR